MSGVRVPRVLTIAGSDPSGGAGIQGDLKSIAANGGYGMAAITALTAQNTRGVSGVHVPPADFLTAQLDAISDDIAIDAVKIGMLATADVIDAVAEWLARVRPPIVVLDPVMVATSGDRLLDADAERALRRLAERADLVTPNLPELAVLTGEEPATTWADALAQAERPAHAWGVRVLVKGGHLSGPDAPDALVTAGEPVIEFAGVRIETDATHGTGCALSSAVATRRAVGGEWETAVREAKEWLLGAIRAGDNLEVGSGHGPVSHFHALWPDAEPASAAWWRDTAAVRAAIDALPFVTALGDGTLDDDVFRHYLEQDALYLRDYARVLAKVSALAPTREEQTFWALGTAGALEGELALHAGWLGGEPEVSASDVTRGYLDHLLTAGPDYATIVAAVLPCYWIYQDVGERLAARSHAEHPYRRWLDTYSDPAFAEATREAIRIADRVAAQASVADRERMAAAFRRSAEHELAFFDQRPD